MTVTEEDKMMETAFETINLSSCIHIVHLSVVIINTKIDKCKQKMNVNVSNLCCENATMMESKEKKTPPKCNCLKIQKSRV